MTTFKILKHNGFTIIMTKHGSEMWVKATKRIPLKTFKAELSAQDLINLT